jgi:hypothetical protein
VDDTSPAGGSAVWYALYVILSAYVIGELTSHLTACGLSMRPAAEAAQKHIWRITATTASFAEAVRETEEVVPVNVSTWVLPSGVTVGR